MASWARLAVLAALVAVATAAFAATVGAATITVTPPNVPAGSAITVSGEVFTAGGQPGCSVPGQVTLISPVFGGLGAFAGVAAATAQADASGHFSITTTVAGNLRSGRYQVGGRCGGGNLGVTATVTVARSNPTSVTQVLFANQCQATTMTPASPISAPTYERCPVTPSLAVALHRYATANEAVPICRCQNNFNATYSNAALPGPLRGKAGYRVVDAHVQYGTSQPTPGGPRVDVFVVLHQGSGGVWVATDTYCAARPADRSPYANRMTGAHPSGCAT